MTALKKYARLEATGLWRPTPDDQRREVVVSIGDATLVISSTNDTALTHWSLAAIERAGTGDDPATFYPDGDPGETLQLQSDEVQMIEAIETLRRAVTKSRPRPGRLRWLGATLSTTAVVALLIFWLPGALVNHAMRVVPHVTRTAIGNELLARIERVAGPPCQTPETVRPLAQLAARTGATGGIAILREGVRTSLALPGGKVLLNRALVEDYEEPDVVAGYILAEEVRRGNQSGLRDLLSSAGLRASITLLTTGELPERALDRYAETVVAAARPAVSDQDLLAAFANAQLRSTPYAYAKDISGERTLALIEGDPMAGQSPAPIMKDADWLRLQVICGG